jgi:hypothetical protein
MRSLNVALLGAILVFVIVPSSSAQVIDFGTSTSGGLFFSAEGGGNFRLRLCAEVVHGKCVGDLLEGPAWASGKFGQDNGVYNWQGNATYTGTFTGCVGGTCNWILSGPSVNFEFSPNKSGKTDWLSGTLTMMGLTEVPEGKVFLDTITVQLSTTGGLLAPYFSHGVVVLQFLIRTKGILEGHNRFARLLTGSLTTCSERMR